MPDRLTSVIVPIFNVGRYLDDCLSSLAAQTASEMEVILVDDGSTDNSSTVARDFSARFPHFHYLRTENEGLGAARNRGLAAARGDLIMFVDGDDVVTRNFVATMTTPLLANPQSDIAICGFRTIDVNGGAIGDGNGSLAHFAAPFSYIVSGEECFVWTKCFRRALIGDLRFHPGRFEDLSLVPHLLCAARSITFVPEVLYLYRQRPGSLGSDRPVDEAHLFQVFAAIAYLRRFPAPDTALWQAFETAQLPNHATLYRLRELLGLFACKGEYDILVRYAAALDEAVPGWSQFAPLWRRLSLRRPSRRLILGSALLALGNDWIRPVLVPAAKAWQSYRQRGRDDGSVVSAPQPVSAYDIVECRGVRIAVDRTIFAVPIIESLRSQMYEIDEERALAQIMRSGDVVLEIGGGCGYLSTFCARRTGAGAVHCVEADRRLIPIIRETHRLNGVQVSVYNEVLGAEAGVEDFYLRDEFWASSVTPGRHVARAIVERRPLQARLNEINPTIVVVDIEGGEAALFDGTAMPDSVRVILMEVHDAVIGGAGIKRVFDVMSALNFRYEPRHSHNSIVAFSRLDLEPLAA